MDQSLPRAYVSWCGEAGLDAAFPFPFPLAAAAEAEGSSDLREEADGGRLLVRRPGGAAEVAELMAKFAAELLGAGARTRRRPARQEQKVRW